MVGKECAAFVDEARRSLLREKDLGGVWLSGHLLVGWISGKMGVIMSPPGKDRFAPKLLGEDLVFTEFGLGGNPPLPELELGVNGLSNLKKYEELSIALAGICREDKFARLNFGNKDASIPFSSSSCF